MKNSHFCQSCSMPLEINEMKGTEKDGSKSNDYCMYCYQNGSFTEPDISLEEMKKEVIIKIESLKFPGELKWEMQRLSERLLPGLKRWSGGVADH